MKVNLTIVNATDQTLYPAQASHMSISATSIAPGASALATGSFQQIGDLMKLTIDGQLSLYLNSAKSGTPFKVDVVTYGGDVTGFHTTAPDGYVLGYHLTPNPNSYIFDVTATAYPALTVDKDAHGYAIDLTSDPMNYAKTSPYVFADFINAMFNPKVRSTAVIETAGKAITNHWDADEAPPVFFADFTGADHRVLLVGALLVLACATWIWRVRRDLDVLALGRAPAIGLGLDHRSLTLRALVAVAVLVSVATALVGPTTFFGLLVAHLAYQLFASQRHAVTVPAAALCALITLIGGQIIFERLLGFEGSLSIVVEFLGGIVFIVLLCRRAAK